MRAPDARRRRQTFPSIPCWLLSLVSLLWFGLGDRWYSPVDRAPVLLFAAGVSLALLPCLSLLPAVRRYQLPLAALFWMAFAWVTNDPSNPSMAHVRAFERDVRPGMSVAQVEAHMRSEERSPAQPADFSGVIAYPTGKRDGLDSFVVRFVNGRVVERYVYDD